MLRVLHTSSAAAYIRQPKIAAILAALRSKRGATIAELANGGERTIRSILSRLRSVAGLTVTFKDEKRDRVYWASPKRGR